jgi:preprotein translocase subunit SecE
MANSENSGASKLSVFWSGVKTEFKKIIWPTKATVGKQLAAVLIVSAITGLIIVAVDFGSQKLIDYLLTL